MAIINIIKISWLLLILLISFSNFAKVFFSLIFQYGINSCLFQSYQIIILITIKGCIPIYTVSTANL